MFSYDNGPGAKQVAVIISDDDSRDGKALYSYENPPPRYLQQMVPQDRSSEVKYMRASTGGLVPYQYLTADEMQMASQFVQPRGGGRLRGGVLPGSRKRAKVEETKEKKVEDYVDQFSAEQQAYEQAAIEELKKVMEEKEELAYNTAYNQTLAAGQDTASAIAGARVNTLKRKELDFPQPRCHPDQMSDAEYEAYTNTLSDDQYDQFKEYFDLSDSESDDEKDEKLFQGYASSTTQQPQPAMTMLPDGGHTPLAHVGDIFTQQGSGGAKLSRKEQKMLRQGLESDSGGFVSAGPRAPVLQKRFDEAKTAVANRTGGRELELYGSDRFQLVPSFPKRECLYVTGPQGAGKSTFAAAYASQWKKQHPGGEIYVFSQLMVDPVLDKLGPIRIELDQGFVDNPIGIEELNGRLCIFDDIDKIKDEKLCAAVRDLRDRLLEIGRKEDTWVVSTSHYVKNWSKTRASINESEKLVFFLNKGATIGIRKYLKDDLGWDKDTIGRVIGTGKQAGSGLKSRWVVINNVMPQWFMGETLISLV